MASDLYPVSLILAGLTAALAALTLVSGWGWRRWRRRALQAETALAQAHCELEAARNEAVEAAKTRQEARITAEQWEGIALSAHERLRALEGLDEREAALTQREVGIQTRLAQMETEIQAHWAQVDAEVRDHWVVTCQETEAMLEEARQVRAEAEAAHVETERKAGAWKAELETLRHLQPALKAERCYLRSRAQRIQRELRLARQEQRPPVLKLIDRCTRQMLKPRLEGDDDADQSEIGLSAPRERRDQKPDHQAARLAVHRDPATAGGGSAADAAATVQRQRDLR